MSTVRPSCVPPTTGLIAFAGDELKQRATAPGTIGVDGDPVGNTPGDGHPLRALRQPARRDVAWSRWPRGGEREPDGGGLTPVRRREDITRGARGGDGQGRVSRA